MTQDPDSEDFLVDSPALPAQVSPHPKALGRFAAARFFERLAFYTMRNWLILFFMTKTQTGGDSTVLYTYYHWVIAAVICAQLPGGFFIDRWYDRRRAVVWGGAMLATGYFILAFDHQITTAIGLVLAIAGMALYGPGSVTAMASFYRGREQYLGAGMFFYFGWINLGAFLASLFLSFLASTLSWQQGCMLAGILMMMGHVYLLAVTRAFQEKKLDAEVTHTDRQPQPDSGLKWMWLVLVILGFAFYSFALKSGYVGLGQLAATTTGMRDWSNLSTLVITALCIALLFVGSQVLTAQPMSMRRMLGFGLLLSVVAGLILPGVAAMGHLSTPSGLVFALSAFLIIVVAITEVLVTPATYSAILHGTSRHTHTWIGLLSVLAYLPFANALAPGLPGGEGGLGLTFTLVAVTTLAFSGMWLLQKDKG